MARVFDDLCEMSIVAIVVFLSINRTEQLQYSQAHALLRIRLLLNKPSVLSSWTHHTDFCNIEPNPSLAIVCYGDTVTQLHIVGENGSPQLPSNFSMESLIATLVRLQDLKVLTLSSLGLWGSLAGKKTTGLSSLEILNVSSNFISGPIPDELSSLPSLQTLILDENAFSGRLPDWIGQQLTGLIVLSLKKNSLNGSLPDSLGDLINLRVLAISHNGFHGPVPDLSRITNLQVLDLEDNYLGGPFPSMSTKLVTIIVKSNNFRSGIPTDLSSFYQLQQLDLSFNSFIGPFPQSIFALPSINYIDIAGNKFTGMLSENQSCNEELVFVDLSSNLLTGNLPVCLSNKKVYALYAGNCLSSGEQDQRPVSSCGNQAFAVGVIPRKKERRQASSMVLALGITGGILGTILLAVSTFIVVRRKHAKGLNKVPSTKVISETASSGYTSKIVTSDARYLSHTTKLGGALGLPPYRTFSLEEIEEATGNFDSSAFMGEGSHGQMYRGQLKDGSLVAVRCLKMKKSQEMQNFMHHIEILSKLRHPHVVSAMGHCFECYWDDSSVSRTFLVFEYVPNGTLGSWISGRRRSRQMLTWAQRIAAAIGISKGIQFLHTEIHPGMYSNNLKITDVLLDQNHVAKISSYNLPLLGEETGKEGIISSTGGSKCIVPRVNRADKDDIYDLGVILMELIVGRTLKSKSEIDNIMDQAQSIIAADAVALRSIVDPTVQKASSDQSLKTVTEISLRCLQRDPADRPSMEDVLWNLQFAAQVQDGWRDSCSTEGSPVSPIRIPSFRVNMR